MDKQKLTLEYPLQARSANIIWDMVATAAGLQKWMANEVVETADDLLEFTWGEAYGARDTRVARIMKAVKPSFIRLHWEEEEDDAYWEMRLEKSDITGYYHLVVTDFAEPDEMDGLRVLWDSNMDLLHRCSGI